MLDICGIKCIYLDDELFGMKFEENNLQSVKQKIKSLDKPLDKYTFYIYKNRVITYNLDCVHVVNQWEKVTSRSIEKLLEQ